MKTPDEWEKYILEAVLDNGSREALHHIIKAIQEDAQARLMEVLARLPILSIQPMCIDGGWHDPQQIVKSIIGS